VSPAAQPGAGYREPSEAVVRLLTATPPPESLLHASSGQVALLFRQPVIALERLARARLGLAGFRFDPDTRSSGVAPLVSRVEIVSLGEQDAPVVWQPEGGALLEFVRFSPDGRIVSALAVSPESAHLALFEVASRVERRLDVPVNAAWGSPCAWVSSEELLCRTLPADRGAPPPDRVNPLVVEHTSGPAPTRTWSNLLESPYEDELFEYYFGVALARVGIDGSVAALAVTPGLLSAFAASADGDYAVLTRIERPYSHLVPARQFPSVIELWDLERGARLYASRAEGFGLSKEETEGREDPRRAEWKPGSSTTLGFIERTREGDAVRHRFMELDAPFEGRAAREIARSDDAPIRSFGWTVAGTPFYSIPTADGTGVRIFVVFESGVEEIWTSSTEEPGGNPGRALRVEGQDGPVLEVEGRIFLAGDGLGVQGPEPFLDAFDLRTRQRERLFTAPPGEFEVVLGLLGPFHEEEKSEKTPALVTVRETESEPPNLFVRRGETRTAVRPLASPYPELDRAQRRVVTYRRADGVLLSGSLYTPAGWQGTPPLPTLVWIYPYEFGDRDHAEQMDVRDFQYHRVKGPSPLAAVLEGYAVLLNPTVPIVQTAGGMNDDYIPQLVASAEAAVEYLVEIGVTAPGRVAVAGRSYGAFSSANLLVHSRQFATALAMSGAYNRSLTPFGFQHEKRTFWEATALYTKISPFFHADQIEAPILLVHGGSDENPGTPPLQARRFFHALVGEGVPARYVELPYEGHHYWARESVLDASAEMLEWLDRTIGAASVAGAAATAGGGAAPPAGK
jgi:dienelactone hydrolase